MRPWFLKAYKALVIEVAFLIIFGGAVRVANAGLACPDWPLCFGSYIPDFHPQVYFEFIHRVLAGTVGFVTLGLAIVLFVNKSASTKLKWLSTASLLLLISQIVLGGLTVRLQLKSGVVAAHLAIGTAFFASLLWTYLELVSEYGTEFGIQNSVFGIPNAEYRIPDFLYSWTRLLTAAVYGQILLGGMVASNYAALACTEFPKCQGQWFPDLVGPVGIHMIHRFGAYTVAALVLMNTLLMIRAPKFLKNTSLWMAGLVIVQICLGVANVLYYTPPLLAVLHLAVGVNIFYLAIRQMHFTSHAVIEDAIEPGGRLAEGAI